MIESERTIAIHGPDLTSYWALLAPMVLASERPVESSFGRKQICSWATRRLDSLMRGPRNHQAILRNCPVTQALLFSPRISFGAQEGTI